MSDTSAAHTRRENVIQKRKKLRQFINKKYPMPAKQVFDSMFPGDFSAFEIRLLEPICNQIGIDTEALDEMCSSYGARSGIMRKEQFIAFMNDDLPAPDIVESPATELTLQQKFVLSKFVGILKAKFGPTISDRWNSAIQRNPPEAGNTKLRISTLCKIYTDANLPFPVPEFVDALFAFYGQKTDSLTISQYEKLFSAFI